MKILYKYDSKLILNSKSYKNKQVKCCSGRSVVLTDSCKSRVVEGVSLAILVVNISQLACCESFCMQMRPRTVRASRFLYFVRDDVRILTFILRENVKKIRFYALSVFCSVQKKRVYVCEFA